MGPQPGFFDLEEPLAGLSPKGDGLERLSAAIDFELFRPELERAVPVIGGPWAWVKSSNSTVAGPPDDHPTATPDASAKLHHDHGRYRSEPLRAALNQLAAVAPAWLREVAPNIWYERYGRRVENYRLPRTEAARLALAAEIGADVTFQPTDPATRIQGRQPLLGGVAAAPPDFFDLIAVVTSR